MPDSALRPIGGHASFDPKLDALARLVRSIASERGYADPARGDDFLAVGGTHGNRVDVVVAIGDKTVTNHLHGVTRLRLDFPAAPALAD